MDKLTTYQNLIIDYLQAFAKNSKLANMPDVESHVIIDRENKHFQLLRVGWQGKRFVFGVVFHFQIKNGKIWIHQNITEHEVAEAFLEKGVPPEEIVLGFRSPFARQYTGLGIG
ncbi:MAG: XisI protein [Bacteroidota bacterium]